MDKIQVQNSNSILGFATTGGGQWKVWDRYITIEGKHAYHIGNVCGTCAFFFERMEGANKRVQVEKLVGSLNAGIGKLNGQLVDELKQLLPDGNYLAAFSVIQPQLCTPLGPNDYFSREQIDLWGVNGFWAMPHSPKTEYYRLETKSPGDQKGLFEFLIPTFPHTWLNSSRLEEYKRVFENGDEPTAVALGVLDIKEPAFSEKDAQKTGILSHWCLAHYLLDGHHKVYASALNKKPITLISFIALDQGISSEADVNWLFDKRQLNLVKGF